MAGRVVGALSLTAWITIFSAGPVRADDTDSNHASAITSSAQLQQQAGPHRRWQVRWHGQTVTAFPVRVRMDSQTSPLAYSLDITRSASYGDTWSAAPIQTDGNGKATLSYGINNTVPAIAAARGMTEPATYASSNIEYAARQVAIWSLVDGLPVTRKTVPNVDLRQRARRIVQGVSGRDVNVNLQAASHAVSIFVRAVSGNKVTLSVVTSIDANFGLDCEQNVDLYLDGVRVSTRTGETTHVDYDDKAQKYKASTTFPDPAPCAGPDERNNTGKVVIDRNTSVVEASATWVGVRIEPGLIMIPNGSAPPLLTADMSQQNFTGATRLDPDTYGGAKALLDRTGSAVLARLTTWQLWVVLFTGLYLVSRAGKIADWLLKQLWRGMRAATRRRG